MSGRSACTGTRFAISPHLEANRSSVEHRPCTRVRGRRDARSGRLYHVDPRTRAMMGRPADRIALTLSLSSRQVRAANRYIEEHRDKVAADYQEMLDRDARGNPPELQAKLDAGHERFLAMVRERREAEQGGEQDARPS